MFSAELRVESYKLLNREVFMEEKRTFEESAARIDEIVRLLERGDAPLDESLALFEEGATLIKVCGKMLDEAEQVVMGLQKGSDDEPIVSLFDEG
jgi:exodeoxyribonuclease VII small subunit